jgi:hypothetical protein
MQRILKNKPNTFKKKPRGNCRIAPNYPISLHSLEDALKIINHESEIKFEENSIILYEKYVI